MPLGKIAAGAAAVMFAALALLVAVGVGVGEQAVSAPEPQPAAVPLAKLPSATPTTTEAIPEQPKEEAKAAPITPKPAEPKALFKPPAEEKPRPVSPKPAPVPASSSGGDRDCPDFGSQAEAQRFFLANGGPSSDPHRLDRDHNGIACESN